MYICTYTSVIRSQHDGRRKRGWRWPGVFRTMRNNAICVGVCVRVSRTWNSQNPYKLRRAFNVLACVCVYVPPGEPWELLECVPPNAPHQLTDHSPPHSATTPCIHHSSPKSQPLGNVAGFDVCVRECVWREHAWNMIWSECFSWLRPAHTQLYITRALYLFHNKYSAASRTGATYARERTVYHWQVGGGDSGKNAGDLLFQPGVFYGNCSVLRGHGYVNHWW